MKSLVEEELAFEEELLRLPRHIQLRIFICKMLGSQLSRPLMVIENGPNGKESLATGAMLNSIVDAFEKMFPDVESKRTEPDVSGPEYSEKHVCYKIRNSITGTSYIGLASNGFRSRYPKGWWVGHHNVNLRRDLELYGRTSFTIHVYVCTDKEDMARTEAALLRVHRGTMYNIAPEEG